MRISEALAMLDRMKKLLAVACVILIVAGVSIAQQQQQGVGLGVEAGATFPQGQPESLDIQDWEPSFSWGFYVNIPLIRSFHITPSARLYKLNGENTTDVDLGFKFIVPLSGMNLYAGFTPGITTVSDVTAPHVGLVGGTSFDLVSNLDLFAQGTYQISFTENRNFRILNLGAGVLFEF